MLEYGDPGYMEQNRGPMLYSITFTVFGLAVVITFLRLYCRLWLLRTVLVSDYLIMLAITLDGGKCAMIHMQIKTGMGRHIEYSRAHPDMFRESMKVGLAGNVLYQALVGVIKSSILAQFLKLALPGPQKKFIIGFWIFVGVFGIFVTFAAIFQCIPVSAAFNLSTFPKGCWNMMVMNFFTSTVNTVVDVVIFIIPIPVLAKLHIERKKKVALAAAFSAGIISITASIVRLRNMVLFNGIGDFTYDAAMVPVWDAIEVNSGIICASIPALMPLFINVTGVHSQSSLPTSAPLYTPNTMGNRPLGSRLNFSGTKPAMWYRMHTESSKQGNEEPLVDNLERMEMVLISRSG